MATLRRPAVVWSIAGSDSGAGAGIQADLRAFAAFGVHGCSAVAALTAQNSVAVKRIEAVSPEMLDAQLAALAEDMVPVAIKTGMLATSENVAVVARWVDRLRRQGPLALVVDPIRHASSGAVLARAELREALVQELLPRATLVKPNRAEAAWLAGLSGVPLAQDLPEIAGRLRGHGARAVVITGGDAHGPYAADWLDTPQARGWLFLPSRESATTHGTGCTWTASAAAALALGFCEADASVLAKMATTDAVEHGHRAGAGAGPACVAPGFASRPDLLPMLSPVSPEPVCPFRPLAYPAMGLYPIVDSAEWVERVLAAGVRTVQLRIKADDPRCAADPSFLPGQISRSVQAARAVDAQLFIDDHWQLAIAAGAYGVHLGQEDLQTADVGAVRAAGLRLGVSTHSYWEVCRAHALAPSYIACGPIHATITKEMPWWPQGNGNLAYWCDLLEEPVVAIAGMDEQRSTEAARCGAAGIAVLRGITQAQHPEAAIRRLSAVIDQGRAMPRRAAPSFARSTLEGPVPIQPETDDD